MSSIEEAGEAPGVAHPVKKRTPSAKCDLNRRREIRNQVTNAISELQTLVERWEQDSETVLSSELQDSSESEGTNSLQSIDTKAITAELEGGIVQLCDTYDGK
jgi:hypothetical protein